MQKNTAAAAPKTLALFVTCLVDQIMPEIGAATVKLLRGLGYVPQTGRRAPSQSGNELHFPAAQTCCGQPFFNSGFRHEARRLAQSTIQTLEPYHAVVLPSGSCTAMIRLEYPHLFAQDPAWHPRATALAAKTFELSEFLTTHPIPPKNTQYPIPNTQSPIPNPQYPISTPPITYHDSCHMCRALGLREQPRQVLAAAGCEIREMTEPDRCCGFGGLFSVHMPEVSNAMTAEKLRQAAQTGAQTLVTADPGCLMQMRGLADNLPETRHLRIEHLAVVLSHQ